IDPHVHARDLEEAYKEDFSSVSCAAVRGGVTSIVVMPNTRPRITTMGMLDAYRGASHKSIVPVFYWMGTTRANSEDLARALERGSVVGAKIYRTYGDDLRIDDDEVVERIFRIAAEADKPVAVHAARHETIVKNLASLGREPTFLDHHAIYSPETEYEDVSILLAIARRTKCAVYFCHCSCLESVELISRAKAEGMKVWAEVCLHHLVLIDRLLFGPMPGFFKVLPPLRPSLKRELVARLATGTIDTLATDHAPHTRSEKEQSYRDVPSGLPGLEWFGEMVYPLVVQGAVDIRQFSALTSENVAQIFRISAKGKLKPGYDADLVLIDDRGLWQVGEQWVRSETGILEIREEPICTKAGWSPYRGLPTTARVVLTMVRGIVCYDPDHIVSEARKGGR
ncbi:MAG: dihydroorotase family protein, partial [Parcubacteria group bacterium]|nr:dihydroorotase family protein [Parcubacteria group bacterium]